MKKVFQLGLTLAAAVVISACGSSGGGSNDNNANAAKPQTNTSTPSTNANNSAAKPVQNNSTGGAIVMSGGIDVKNTKLNDPSLTELNIDGTRVQIAFPGIYSGGWSNLSAGNIGEVNTCCGKYKNVRFGAVGSLNENQKDYLFYYNGTPTTAMPTSGTAQYNGESVIAGKIAPQFDNEDYLQGKSTFNVDFGAKTVNGALNIDTLKPVEINANISGNSFDGTARSSDFATQAKVEGKFFGTDAKEIGGIFTDGKTWGGAFGGSK